MNRLLIRTGVAWGIAILTGLVAFTFGFSFGNVGNQETYLTQALNSIDPDFLKNDWLIEHTASYHDRFKPVIAGLSAVGPTGWTLALTNLLLTVVGFSLIYRCLAIVVPTFSLTAFPFILLFAMLDSTTSVAGTYIFSGGLQPSALASAAWLGAILFFLSGNAFASGCVLALGGIFHANFLVLGIGNFGLAQLALGRNQLLNRLAMQLGPSLIVLLLDLPLLLSASTGEGAEIARWVFQQIRAPHHYVPANYLIDFWAWGGWMLAGLGAAVHIESLSIRRAMLVLLCSIALHVSVATLLTTVVFVPTVSQIFVWRLAPFGVVLSQVAIAAFAVRFTAGKIGLRQQGIILSLVLIAAGLLGVLRWHLHTSPFQMKQLALVAVGGATAILGGFASKLRSSAAHLPTALAMFCIGFLLLILPERIRAVFSASTIFRGPGVADELRLYEWSGRSPKGSVFLIPPELGSFRVLSGRAVVIDWKSTPIRPAELIEWHQRIEAVAGRKVGAEADAIEGFRSQSLVSLRHTADNFGAGHVVIDTMLHIGEIGSEEPEFATGRYRVYPVRELSSLAAEVFPRDHSAGQGASSLNRKLQDGHDMARELTTRK